MKKIDASLTEGVAFVAEGHGRVADVGDQPPVGRDGDAAAGGARGDAADAGGGQEQPAGGVQRQEEQRPRRHQPRAQKRGVVRRSVLLQMITKKNSVKLGKTQENPVKLGKTQESPVKLGKKPVKHGLKHCDAMKRRFST